MDRCTYTERLIESNSAIAEGTFLVFWGGGAIESKKRYMRLSFGNKLITKMTDVRTVIFSRISAESVSLMSFD